MVLFLYSCYLRRIVSDNILVVQTSEASFDRSGILLSLSSAYIRLYCGHDLDGIYNTYFYLEIQLVF